MAAPAYPLRTILEQRADAKERAKKDLAEALRAIVIEEERLALLGSEREALCAERAIAVARLYDSDTDGLLSIAAVQSRKGGISHLDATILGKDREIEAQRAAVERARENAETRKADLVEADKAMKAIEKHREKWLEEVKREAAQREQKNGEEIALAKFVRESAARAEEEGDEDS